MPSCWLVPWGPQDWNRCLFYRLYKVQWMRVWTLSMGLGNPNLGTKYGSFVLWWQLNHDVFYLEQVGLFNSESIPRGRVTFLMRKPSFSLFFWLFDSQMSPNLASSPRCHVYLEYCIVYYICFLQGRELKYGVQGLINFTVFYLHTIRCSWERNNSYLHYRLSNPVLVCNLNSSQPPISDVDWFASPSDGNGWYRVW